MPTKDSQFQWSVVFKKDYINRKTYYNLPNSAIWGWLSIESQPQNPEFRNNHENFHPCILSLKINFVVANSADPDEMPHDAAFHLDLHYLSKYQFRGFQSIKGYELISELRLFAHLTRENLSSGLPTRWDSNQFAQLQRLSSGVLILTREWMTKVLIILRKCGSAVAQWKSAWLETAGPRVRASPASLRCVLEQEH